LQWRRQGVDNGYAVVVRWWKSGGRRGKLFFTGGNRLAKRRILHSDKGKRGVKLFF